MHSTI
ncbi:hypothetical protein Zm00014a_041566 [Zea mays]